MAHEANTLAALPSTDQTVRAVSNHGPDRPSLLSEVMHEVRGWLGGHKVSEQLAVILDCDVRSAARYLAGDRIPSGDVVFGMMLDPRIGPRVMASIADRARRDLSPADFQTFKEAMAEATLSAFVRKNNERRGAPMTD